MIKMAAISGFCSSYSCRDTQAETLRQAQKREVEVGSTYIVGGWRTVSLK